MGIANTLIELDADLAAKSTLTRGTSDSLPGVSGKLSEARYDELLVLHHAAVAEALRDAELIERDSRLVVLGRQILKIDVLMAEVGPNDKFRRLVMFEDKLLRNPESSRKVVGQLLEYARRLEQADPEEVLQVCGDKCSDPQWLEGAEKEIGFSINQGDFLLLVCGDEPHPDMLGVVRMLTQHLNANPLSSYDLGVVAMTIYSDGDRRFLLPQVVSSVAPPTRELVIRVVRDDGQAVAPKPVVVKDEQQRRKTAKRATEGEFFAEFGTVWTADRVDAFRQFVAAVEKADVGAKVIRTSFGRPQVSLEQTRYGSVTLFAVRGKAAELEDYLHLLLKNPSCTPEIDIAITDFRMVLKDLPGATETATERVRVPLASTMADLSKVIGAVQVLWSVLQDGEAG